MVGQSKKTENILEANQPTNQPTNQPLTNYQPLPKLKNPGFRDNYAAIAAAGFDVYGLSLDAAAAQTAWAEEHALGYPLLTDTPEAAALTAFAALKPDDGSGALKILRSHAVVGKGGAVLLVENGVKSDASFGDALAFVTRHAAGQ